MSTPKLQDAPGLRTSPEIVAAEEARTFIVARGGRLYVRADRHRRCSGALTLLDASIVEPAGDACYRRLPADSFTVYLDERLRPLPRRLDIALTRYGRRLDVLWNGCAYVL